MENFNLEKHNQRAAASRYNFPVFSVERHNARAAASRYNFPVIDLASEAGSPTVDSHVLPAWETVPVDDDGDSGNWISFAPDGPVFGEDWDGEGLLKGKEWDELLTEQGWPAVPPMQAPATPVRPPKAEEPVAYAQELPDGPVWRPTRGNEEEPNYGPGIKPAEKTSRKLRIGERLKKVGFGIGVVAVWFAGVYGADTIINGIDKPESKPANAEYNPGISSASLSAPESTVIVTSVPEPSSSVVRTEAPATSSTSTTEAPESTEAATTTEVTATTAAPTTTSEAPTTTIESTTTTAAPVLSLSEQINQGIVPMSERRGMPLGTLTFDKYCDVAQTYIGNPVAVVPENIPYLSAEAQGWAQDYLTNYANLSKEQRRMYEESIQQKGLPDGSGDPMYYLTPAVPLAENCIPVGPSPRSAQFAYGSTDAVAAGGTADQYQAAVDIMDETFGGSLPMQGRVVYAEGHNTTQSAAGRNLDGYSLGDTITYSVDGQAKTYELTEVTRIGSEDSVPAYTESLNAVQDGLERFVFQVCETGTNDYRVLYVFTAQ